MPEPVVARGPAVCPEPEVSVVIPAYQAAWLDATLDSLRAQTVAAFEIIVVDDGSPEPVAPARVDDLVLLRQANAGPATARNRGVAAARGALIAFCDADDLWRPEKLERHLAAHRSHPHWLASGTDIAIFGDGLEPTVRTREALYGVPGGEVTIAQLFRENCFVTSTMLVDRAAYLEVGGMPEPREVIGIEDFGCWLRLATRGTLGHVPEVLTDYRVHAAGLTSSGVREGSFFAKEMALRRLFLSEFPRLASEPWARQGLAHAEFQRGYALLRQGDWLAARAALRHSLGHWPLSLVTWRAMVLALLRVRPRGRAR